MRPCLFLKLLIVGTVLGFPCTIPSAGLAQSSLSADYAQGDAKLSPSERAGREIWFFATAFNDRFYTYSLSLIHI